MKIQYLVYSKNTTLTNNTELLTLSCSMEPSEIAGWYEYFDIEAKKLVQHGINYEQGMFYVAFREKCHMDINHVKELFDVDMNKQINEHIQKEKELQEQLQELLPKENEKKLLQQKIDELTTDMQTPKYNEETLYYNLLIKCRELYNRSYLFSPPLTVMKLLFELEQFRKGLSNVPLQNMVKFRLLIDKLCKELSIEPPQKEICTKILSYDYEKEYYEPQQKVVNLYKLYEELYNEPPQRIADCRLQLSQLREEMREYDKILNQMGCLRRDIEITKMSRGCYESGQLLEQWRDALGWSMMRVPEETKTFIKKLSKYFNGDRFNYLDKVLSEYLKICELLAPQVDTAPVDEIKTQLNKLVTIHNDIMNTI